MIQINSLKKEEEFMNENNKPKTYKKQRFGIEIIQCYKDKQQSSAMIGSSQKFMKQSNVYNEEQLDTFRQLQGDCKIDSVRYLRFSIVKSILLTIPLAISIFGLFLLKYYGRFRANVFYNEAEIQEATHLLIVGEDNSKKIEKIFMQENVLYFIYRKLKYKIAHGQIIPVGLNFTRFFKQNVNQRYVIRGLSKQSHKIQLQRYGKNEHTVQPPNYFEYAFKELTQPFFVIQYLAAVIYFAQKVATLAVLLLVASVFTVSLNYILLYLSYKKIKDIAEKEHKVIVVREGQQLTISHTQIVPGDIIILQAKQEIPCDCILLTGQAYVNEASLTGESIPIGKFPCINIDQSKHSNRWLYEGSIVLSVKEQTHALSIRTGYTSRRGRIIRKILTKKQTMPEFFKSVIYFLVEIYIIGGLIAYFASLPVLLNADIQNSMIVLLFFLFITFCFPPAFPIYFNLAYSLCLARLKFKDIYRTEPEKTISGTNLKIMCFDKTGTLTEEKVNLHKIFRLTTNIEEEVDITTSICREENYLSRVLFATCHTVKQFDSKFQGDQIDLKMFICSNAVMKNSQSPDVRCQITDNQGKKYQVLRINQYESKFQSMSVLIRDVQKKKYYVFSKGAPEKMHSYSTVKYQYFKGLISKLSYQGLRTIGYSYKEVSEKEFSQYVKCDRERFLTDTKLIGIVAFQNKLKDDAVDTIKRLKEANIQTKMITGDNIFIGIETAMRAGILTREKDIVVIEGGSQGDHNYIGNTHYYKVKIVSVRDDDFHITDSRINQQQYIYLNKPVAVDNDFLQMDQTPVLIPQIKVFARISPENKARIIRLYKQQFRDRQDQQGLWHKITGKPVERVGMAGDGANDLIALKQADIGMGISNSDASYAATFSINNLLDIDEILRQSKGTERSIIEICRFYAITNFLSIPLVIMLLSEGTFFGDTQLLYLNLSKLIIINLAIPLSRASPQPTKFKPQSNFLGLQSHLVFWGNVLIYAGGYTAAYVYGRYFSGQHIPNPFPTVTFNSGYYQKTFSTTILFICFNMQSPTLVLFLYKSKPWKERIWGSIILSLIIVINIGIGIAAFFLTNELAKGLDLVGMSRKVEVTVFIIMLITVVVAFLYNLLIDCLKLHQRQFFSNQYKNQPSTQEV